MPEIPATLRLVTAYVALPHEELVTVHVTDRERIHEKLREQGRVILAIDGLQPDAAHEVLWVIRDCLSQEILLARPLLSSAQGDLTALLREVKALLPPVPVLTFTRNFLLNRERK